MDEPRNFMLEAYEQARATMENTVNDLAAKALEEAYRPNKVDIVDPSEELGKLAYDAYQQSKYGDRESHLIPWQEQPAFWQKSWIAAAQAVAERVLEMQQAAVEASE